MIKDLLILKPTKEDLTPAYYVFEASIKDAFEKEGIGDLKEDILYEIEDKKSLLKNSVENKDSGIYFLVAKSGDKVIGTISFGPCGSEIKKCTNNQLDTIGELGSLYILPEYQGKGIGSVLIHSMLKFVYSLGIKEFCLDSGYKRAQEKWIRKFGEPYKIAKDYWGKDSDHMVWLCNVIDYV